MNNSRANHSHIKQAARNFKLYKQLLDEGEFMEWAVILLFYTAVQLVDAYASTDPSSRYPFQVHTDRGEYIKARWFVRQRPKDNLWAWYRSLQEDSEDARYELAQYSPEDIANLYRQTFARIESALHARGVSIRDVFPELQPVSAIPPAPRREGN